MMRSRHWVKETSGLATWFRLLKGCCWAILLALLALPGLPAWAGEWPQILGPHRTGIAEGEHLADKWPSQGPPVRWERDVGSGYAGLAVAKGRAVLFHRVSGEEVVEALNAEAGTTAWKQWYATTFYPQVGGGDGPLCVPTIVDNRVITFGAQGVLSCHNLLSGELDWQHRTHEEYGAAEGYFGAGSAPVVAAGLVIVNVGADRKRAGVVAFDLESGEQRWTATSEQPSYSAPTVVSLVGQPHVLMVTRLKCVLIDAKTGGLRFQFPFGSRGPTVNGATPLVWDDHLFVTSSYGVGAVYASFDALSVEKVWERGDVLSTQYCTPILHEGLLYGIDGRDDIPPADLKCVDPRTGELKWIEHDFGYGTMLLADEKIVIAKTDGELVLFRPNPERAEIISRVRAFRGVLRALPALSEGRLYVRDEGRLKCIDLSRSP